MRGSLCGILAGALISVADLIQVLYITAQEVLPMILIRNSIGLVMSLVIILVRKSYRVERHLWLQLTVSCIAYSLGNILYNLSLYYLTIFLVVTIDRLKLVVSLILAKILYKSQMYVFDIIILCLVVIGLVVVALNKSMAAEILTLNSKYSYGLFCIFGTVLLHGYSGILCMKLKEVDAFVIVFWQMFYSVIFSAFGSAITYDMSNISKELLLTCIVLASILPLFLFFLNKSIQLSTAGMAYLAEMSNIPVGLTLQLIFLHQYPSYLRLFGCTFVFLP